MITTLSHLRVKLPSSIAASITSLGLRVVWFVLLFVLLVSGSRSAKAAIVTITNKVAGGYTWVCPAGVTSVQVECWGGGGGGAGGVTSSGGGGAGGAYARTVSYAVTPGTNYYIQVGAAGTGGTAGNNPGSAGGNTWFSNSTPAVVVLAEGGGGGAAGSSSGGGGIGGTCPAGSIGADATYLGGTGLTGVNSSYSGGGGSSAGNASSGNPGVSSGAAAAVAGGGPGGAARSTAGAGSAPTSGPGGGGGGGYSKGGTSQAGGAGFAGQVILTYTAPLGVLNWVGDGANNDWSTNFVDVDWDSNNSGTANSNYSDGALVVFGLEGTNNPTVTIATPVAPTSVSINSASNYVFAGNGWISGATSLDQSGSGLVTINTTNNYVGGTTISAGRIRAGNNNALGTGLVTFSGGALSSVGGTPLTLTNAVKITIATTLGDTTDNGLITLTAPVDFSGAARSITNNSSVVFANGGTDGRIGTKQGVGTLTINGIVNFNGAADVDNGTLIYSGATVTNTDRIIPDASAGNLARLVITNGTTVTISGTVNNLRSGRAGDITGTNYTDLAGLYSLPTATIPNGNVTLYGGCAYAEMTFWPGGDFTAFGVTNNAGVGNTVFKFNGGILRARASNPYFFQGLSSTLIQAGGANIDDGGFAITINQNLLDGGGGGGLNKIGAGSLTLAGANTYTGNTVISNGTLVVNGSLGSGAVTVASGTLGGAGGINGATTVDAGALLAAGNNGIGTLTISSNLTLSASSTNWFVVTTVGGVSNSVAVGGLLSPNGSIIEVNTAGGQLGVGVYTNLFTYASTNGTAFAAAPVFDTPQIGTTAIIVNDGVGDINLVINSAVTTSSDASLSYLAVTPGTLSPAFATGTANYAVTNAYAGSPVTVTVTNTSAFATDVLYLNGNPQATNTGSLASSALPLGVGSTNVIEVVVTAQDGLTVSNYFVTVTRLGSTNALLSNLVISPVALSQPFNSDITSYSATNTYPATNVTVTATSADGTATLALSFNTGGNYGIPLTSGVASANNTLSLISPANVLAVQVISQDLSQTNVYIVNELLEPNQAVPKLTNIVSGNSLNLSWPADHLGYRLQVQTNSLSTNWVTIPGSAGVTATNFPINPANHAAFYRLFYQP